MSEEVKVERKKRSLSLIQPTSIPTLGNYLGAMKGWSAFQEEYDTIYGVADLHSITVRQDPQKLRRQTTELYAMLLALGLTRQGYCVYSVPCAHPFPVGLAAELLHPVWRAVPYDPV